MQPQRKHVTAVAKRIVVAGDFFYKIQTIDDCHALSMHHDYSKSNIQGSSRIFWYSRTMINTTSTAIDNLTKDQTVVLQTPTGNHIMLAKPLFNALHQHFPDASFEVLQTLLEKNAAYGLHIAKQHHLFAMVSFVGSVRRAKAQEAETAS